MLELYVPEIVNNVWEGVELVRVSETVPASAAGAAITQKAKIAAMLSTALRIKPPYFSFPTAGNTTHRAELVLRSGTLQFAIHTKQQKTNGLT